MDLPAIKHAVSDLLNTRPLPTSEYRLLTALSEQGVFDAAPKEPLLALFQKHFILMHCLYSLQREWVAQSRYLSISPLVIDVHNTAEDDAKAVQKQVQHADSNLAEYYLDWQNFEAVDADGVSELMASFWQRFASGGEPTAQALAYLKLPANATWQDIQGVYRKKASSLHPDKGGDATEFAELQNAFDTLKVYYGK